MTRSESFYRGLKEDPASITRAAAELSHHEPTAVAGAIAQAVGAVGFHTLSTACSTGLHAIGLAKRLIESGAYDACLAIGSDALSQLTVRGFASLMLIDFSGCKPFDRRRVGICLGEGAGALLLAAPQAAAKIGLPPLAMVSGWGASADGYHMTAPHPQGEGARRAVTSALSDAGLSPDAISAIATHGTATPDNDVAEIAAMAAIFSKLPPFCSMKRSLGHTLAASGTLEAVFAIKALRAGIMPATGGHAEADEKIGHSPSVKHPLATRHILKNSFGFGGNNAAVIFSQPAEE
jgi:3-oxoacyl-(acyl-carrier-protein) synthase